MALLDGWVRFWYQGVLLPLPAELQRELDAALLQVEEQRHRAVNAERRADEAERRSAEAEQRAEREREARLALQAELAALRGESRRKPEET